MANRTRKKKASKANQDVIFSIYGIVLLAFFLIMIAEAGPVGRNLRFLGRVLLGSQDFLLALAGCVLGGYVFLKRRWPRPWNLRWMGAGMLFLSWVVLVHIADTKAALPLRNQEMLNHTWGLLWAEHQQGILLEGVGTGMIGAGCYALLRFLFDTTGAVVVLFVMGLSGFLLLINTPLKPFWQGGVQWCRRRWQERQTRRARPAPPSSPSPPLPPPTKATVLPAKSAPKREYLPPVIHDFTQNVAPSSDEESPELLVTAEAGRLSPYSMPSLGLLQRSKAPVERNTGAMQREAAVLVEKLGSFGIHASIVSVHRGPSVTRYALQPDAGIKVSKIAALADDMALALAARSIRVEAPIPGESAVGIEVPNQDVAIVTLRELLEYKAFHESTSPLMVALGRDVAGKPIVTDLSRMPHLLVAGATGSGKSVCINSLLMSLLYKAEPMQLRLVLIDPKMVELSIYNGIPHLLAPVVTDARRASSALQKVVDEMERRYRLLQEKGVREIGRYNEGAPEEERLPWIVVVVDELADLMMVAAQEVEESIARLAQKARAAGIHLILATQRPSADVLTGIIKANIPTRIAFAVSSAIDSRIILDRGGAEKLLGRGDMLYVPMGSQKPVRVQGAWVTDEEVEAVVKHAKDQLETDYEASLLPEALEEAAAAKSTASTQDLDPLYEQAVERVIEMGSASATMLQRHLRVGYARAARLLDLLESQGVVGPPEQGGRSRVVRLTASDWQQIQKQRSVSS